MDGRRGRALDNIFVERLWRTVKYERVYLHNYETGSSVNSIVDYMIEAGEEYQAIKGDM